MPVDSNGTRSLPSPPSAEEVRMGSSEEDSHGTRRCPCKCHDVDDDKYKTRQMHCVSCGLKVSHKVKVNNVSVCSMMIIRNICKKVMYL